MSDAGADEKLLLRDIKIRLARENSSWTNSLWYKHVFPTTLYILKNVAELRLDGWKKSPPSASDERRAESIDAELNLGTSEVVLIKFLHIIDHYLREVKKIMGREMVERVISPGMDEHTSTLFFLETLENRYYMNSILVLILTSFAMEHGAWLLTLKSIFADSSEQEDINMVLKRVVSSTRTVRGKAKTDAAEFETGFCIYISLLSSTVRMPSDGWRSMESLYNLIRAMLEVTEVIRFLIVDTCISNLRSLTDEFADLLCLSVYWIVYGIATCSSQCNALPKNGYVIQDSQKLIYVYEKLTSIHRRLQEFKKKFEQFEDDEKIKEAYKIPNKQGRDSYYALMPLFGQPQLGHSEGSDELKLCRCDRNGLIDIYDIGRQDALAAHIWTRHFLQ